MASYPAPDRVFHIVDAVNWNRVKCRGLASTRALLEEALGEAVACDRARAFRPQGVALAGGAYFRDQSPMPPEALSRCLDPGLELADRYSLLNPPAELVIISAVPSLMGHVIDARRVAPGEASRVIAWDVARHEAMLKREAHP